MSSFDPENRKLRMSNRFSLHRGFGREAKVVLLQVGIAILLLRLPRVPQFLWSGDTTPILLRSHAIQELGSVLAPFRIFGQFFSGGSIQPEQGSWFLLILRAAPVALGLDAVWSQRLGIYLIPVIASLSMYLLARSLGMVRWISLFSGSVFAYSPPFFNFLTMGWEYIAWSYALLPFTVWLTIYSFHKSGRLTLAVSGAVAGLLAISSTMLPVYLFVLLLLTFDFLLKTHTSFQFKERIRRTLCFWLVFPLLHLFWFVSRVLYPLAKPLKPLDESGPSLGTVSGVDWRSAISLAGTQYNDSYWRFYPDKLPNVFFVLSAIALVATFTRRFNSFQSTVWVFGVNLISLIILSIIDQSIVITTMNELGLGRDSARLIATASFPIAILVGYFLQAVSTFTKDSSRTTLWILSSLAAILTIYPYIQPGISNSLDDREPGIALRPRQINLTAISRVDELASSSSQNWSVLQLPSFPLVFSANDTRFDGAYQSTTNPWLALSVPTNFHHNDKSTSLYGIELDNGSVARTHRDLLLNIDPGKLAFEMNRFGIRYLVIDQTFLGEIDEALDTLSTAVDSEERNLFSLVAHFESPTKVSSSSFGDVYVFEVVKTVPSVKLFVFGRTPPLDTRLLNVKFSNLGVPSEVLIEKPELNRTDIIVNFAINNRMPITVKASFRNDENECEDNSLATLDQTATQQTSKNRSPRKVLLHASPYNQVSEYIPISSLSVKLENVPTCKGLIQIKISSPMNRLQSVLFIVTILIFGGLILAALFNATFKLRRS